MSAPAFLRPFWNYYGAKWRAAPSYPAPDHGRIVEPFAGAAGYSLRYYQRDVVLVEKYARVAEIWRYLTRVSAAEILRIPYVESVHDLPSWVPQGGRDLVGFCMNAAAATPCVTLSSGRRRMRAAGRRFEGWSDARRDRVASQVDMIRHWVVIEGDYSKAPRDTATWFVDPPYNNKAGSYYKESARSVDYGALGRWCEGLSGQVIACENEGAAWLPFVCHAAARSSSMSGRGGISHEVVWHRR